MTAPTPAPVPEPVSAPTGPVAPPVAPPAHLSVVRQAFFALPNLTRLMWGLMRDSRVAFFDKALLLGALAYLVSPIDLLPDVIPFFGQLDDVVILMLATRRLLGRAPGDVMRAHWRGDPSWLEAGTLTRIIGVLAWFLPVFKRHRKPK